ncbi:MAG: thiamine phosphate synthase [Muribaculaceae bacterium]|nr:thiamine phosphate synthase [Muribaculaceae bacterium]
MKEFLVIGITQPGDYPEEAERINLLFSSGEIDLLHIRKPGISIDIVENLINGIKSEFHSRVKLHDHYDLLEKYKLGGVHLNSRSPIPHPLAQSISKSIHSLEEIEPTDNMDYYFLSPIFDSISKNGYNSKYDIETISSYIRGNRVVALGGVTPDKFSLLKNNGFYGGAMLGYLFPPIPFKN